MSNRPTRKTSASSRVREARKSAETSRTTWIFVVVGALIAVILFAVLIASNTGTEVAGGGKSPSGGTVVPSGNKNFGVVEVSGEPLPQMGDPASGDPAVGKGIPTLKGEAFDGQEIVIGGSGKPMVVMFLAHWCPHCQNEVPRIQEWLNSNGMPADVELFAVASGTNEARPNFPPGRWLRREKWSVPTMVDSEESIAGNAFGLSGFPYFVAVGADGKVVERTSGELTEGQFEGLLDAARAGVATTEIEGGEASPTS